jgi:hypothetical protein
MSAVFIYVDMLIYVDVSSVVYAIVLLTVLHFL